MNKQELVKAIAAKAQITAKDAAGALDAMTEIITEELRNGNRVSITGFGTYEPRTRAARDGVNPRTKESIHIPESRFAAFKPGAVLKAAMKQ